MKKLIAILVAVTVCCAMVLPAAAEEFVPSISYKDYPEVLEEPVIKDDAQQEIEGVELVITPVSDALNTPENEREHYEDHLVDVYEALESGEMKLPEPESDDKVYVIRDLIDISVLDDEGKDVDVATVEVVFDLGLDDGQKVVVMVYDGSEWKVVDGVTYNNDGSVTIVFDTLGPVAFCVEKDGSSTTGDKMASELGIWIGLMAVSACAIVVLIATRRRVRN